MKKLLIGLLLLSTTIFANNNIFLSPWTQNGVQYIEIINRTSYRLICQVNNQYTGVIIYQFYVYPNSGSGGYVRPYVDFTWRCWNG